MFLLNAFFPFFSLFFPLYFLKKKQIAFLNHTPSFTICELIPALCPEESSFCTLKQHSHCTSPLLHLKLITSRALLHLKTSGAPLHAPPYYSHARGPCNMYRLQSTTMQHRHPGPIHLDLPPLESQLEIGSANYSLA